MVWTSRCDLNKKNTFLLSQFQAIQHENLDRESEPCKTEEDYSFQNCIFEQIISEVGCKPYWLDDDLKSEFPSCSRALQIKEFTDRIGEVGQMNERKFRDNFKCLKPCIYMEYKVWNKLNVIIK